MVCPSTPADPALALTSRHALAKTSLRYILSYSTWNRRAGLAFAARYRARWSSRALSRVDLARRALTSAYLPRTRRPSAGPVGGRVTSPPPGRNPTCAIYASGSPEQVGGAGASDGYTQACV